MCFFSLTILIAIRTAPASVHAPLPPATGSARRWAGIAWSAVLAQIVLGGLVRHTASGLACLDVPLCHGLLWPAASPERVQMIHRFGAALAGGVSIFAALRLRRETRDARLLHGLSLLPIALVLLQIGLGVASVLSLLDLAVITTHLAVGAALLGSFVVIWGLCPAPSDLGREATARKGESERASPPAVATS
jgi:cytochrome c oxidase assembly protein subunit 15